MAKRAKVSEPSEPERETGIVKVDEPFPSGDVSPEVDAKPEPSPTAIDETTRASGDGKAVVTRVAPASPPPIVPPDTSYRAPSGPSFGQRVGGFFRFLFRLFLLLIVLTVISVALYIAVPWLYDTLIRPVEQNTAQVQELQSRQEQTEQELANLQTKLQTLETVQNQQDGSLTELDDRMTEIESEIAARTESLAALERLQSELETQNQKVSAELERQINLLKSMELLSRARLSMYQSNFGLARQDVQIARDLLASLPPGAPASLAEELGAVIFRLDMTLSNLPAFPVAASDDLDIAWQILLSGLPQGTQTVTPTPTQARSASVTPSAVDVTITPTIPATQATVQPSAAVLPSATPMP